MTTTNSQANKPVKHIPVWKRKTAHWSRWLHTYLSMASFGILLFFALTGITLNHQSAFTGIVKPTRFTGSVDTAWMKAPDARKDDIIATLRSRHKIRAALADFRIDDDQVQVSFKGPGYATDGFIERTTGKYDLTESRLGFVAVVNDLHKGRDTGKAWATVIDISAGLMTLVSLTGLTLIFFLYKRLRAGLLTLAVGAAICLAILLHLGALTWFSNTDHRAWRLANNRITVIPKPPENPVDSPAANHQISPLAECGCANNFRWPASLDH